MLKGKNLNNGYWYGAIVSTAMSINSNADKRVWVALSDREKVLGERGKKNVGNRREGSVEDEATECPQLLHPVSSRPCAIQVQLEKAFWVILISETSSILYRTMGNIHSS